MRVIIFVTTAFPASTMGRMKMLVMKSCTKKNHTREALHPLTVFTFSSRNSEVQSHFKKLSFNLFHESEK